MYAELGESVDATTARRPSPSSAQSHFVMHILYCNLISGGGAGWWVPTVTDWYGLGILLSFDWLGPGPCRPCYWRMREVGLNWKVMYIQGFHRIIKDNEQKIPNFTEKMRKWFLLLWRRCVWTFDWTIIANTSLCKIIKILCTFYDRNNSSQTSCHPSQTQCHFPSTPLHPTMACLWHKMQLFTCITQRITTMHVVWLYPDVPLSVPEPRTISNRELHNLGGSKLCSVLVRERIVRRRLINFWCTNGRGPVEPTREHEP